MSLESCDRIRRSETGQGLPSKPNPGVWPDLRATPCNDVSRHPRPYHGDLDKKASWRLFGGPTGWSMRSGSPWSMTRLSPSGNGDTKASVMTWWTDSRRLVPDTAVHALPRGVGWVEQWSDNVDVLLAPPTGCRHMVAATSPG